MLISNDTNKPLFNRPLMAQYRPGSIFKIAQAMVALQEGVVKEDTRFRCDRSIINCHGPHSNEDLRGAITHSCNPYFWNVLRRMLNKGVSNNPFDDTRIGLAEWNKHITPPTSPGSVRRRARPSRPIRQQREHAPAANASPTLQTPATPLPITPIESQTSARVHRAAIHHGRDASPPTRRLQHRFHLTRGDPADQRSALVEDGSAGSTPGPSAPGKHPDQHPEAIAEPCETASDLVELLSRYSNQTEVLSELMPVLSLPTEKRHGVARRYRILTPQDIDAAVRLYESGLSLVAVGERLGVNVSTILNALRTTGVQVRPVGTINGGDDALVCIIKP